MMLILMASLTDDFKSTSIASSNPFIIHEGIKMEETGVIQLSDISMQ